MNSKYSALPSHRRANSPSDYSTARTSLVFWGILKAWWGALSKPRPSNPYPENKVHTPSNHLFTHATSKDSSVAWVAVGNL